MSVATKSAGSLRIAAERFPQNHRGDRRIQSMKEESEAIKKTISRRIIGSRKKHIA